ncbi:hypothetical protein [Saccharophagus degradans]|uniref:Uncharacterized protein n=1 Tax=Saccharophagus degradans TaxID=86304 RepID=A0AAW7X7M9_9GAMM|nr:hypothetical protein [Saccharophagus degradans]MDO6423696.1 hypothetical protein [Saccharophagus degradans]MDO6607633.1 hypothetical protein [Saccharophagus degradans]
MTPEDFKTLETAAENHGATISSDTAITWGLASDAEILHCGAQIAGGDTSTLQVALQKHAHSATKLYLSAEPHPAIIDINSLILNLDATALDKCIIKASLPAPLKNQHWQQWEGRNEEKIISLACPQTYSHSRNIAHILSKPTPWNTCISSASVSGNSIALVDTQKEYGVVPEIISRTLQYRAVLYSQSQHELIDLLPAKNNCGELIEYIRIDNLASFFNVLRYCKINRYLHTLTICDMADLAHLTKLNLADEIVHHLITNTQGEPQTASKVTLNNELDLQQWQVLKTDITGPCCRMTLGRRQSTSHLQSGLN